MNAQEPKILIPLLCYNYGRFLPECLDSIIEQTYENWKVVVRDPLSTDQTKQIMSNYVQQDSRIQYVYEKCPITQGAARNKTILENPDFPIIAYHDVDDIMLKKRFELSIEAIRDSHIVYGNAKRFGLHDDVITSFPLVNYTLLLYRNLIVASTVCFRRNVWKIMNGFDEEMYSLSDYDFWLRGLKLGFKLRYINHLLILYRSHQNSITNLKAKKVGIANLGYLKNIKMKKDYDIFDAKFKRSRDYDIRKDIMRVSTYIWRKYNSYIYQKNQGSL